MYHPGDLDHWTDSELVELWLERAAMRDGEVKQVNYLAGQEIRKWIGNRPLPGEIRQGMNKFG